MQGPLIAIALFVMSYLRVFPKMSLMLYFASIIFILGIIQVSTQFQQHKTFLRVLFGELYAIPEAGSIRNIKVLKVLLRVIRLKDKIKNMNSLCQS